jgi:uncharacterized protein (DUF2235 family)
MLCGEHAMGRNIVICCDGTGNEFGRTETNVVRLTRIIDHRDQLLFYDPGVGTMPEPGRMSRWARDISVLYQLALGRGLLDNVVEAFTFLMNYAEADDRVFLFGFSRGAYTVRMLAGLLHMLGLLPKGNENLLPYLKRHYKSIQGTTPEEAKKQWNMCDDFRRNYARSTGHDRHFAVHFVGVWDTVSSVGWFWEPASFPYTNRNPSVQNLLHAISIDERRAFFRTNLMQKDDRNPSQVLHQRWFPGDHCDVGGGHTDGALWRSAFHWIVQGAVSVGLSIDESKLQALVQGSAPFRPWDPPHDTLKGLWTILEFVFKKRWDAKTKKTSYRPNFFRSRSVAEGALIDQSALYCIREAGYEPKNLSEGFIEYVRMMAVVPDELRYQSTVEEASAQ